MAAERLVESRDPKRWPTSADATAEKSRQKISTMFKNNDKKQNYLRFTSFQAQLEARAFELKPVLVIMILKKQSFKATLDNREICKKNLGKRTVDQN